eukprot:TRINITY_DN7076_c2_g5_i1.p1 TRINITY_DN7076_c2_g5~~TRINITY_DN7076_c2_g5_i1.p1  ORF type:complete len:575 (+),score=210.68 TRINITY_DN7076_c2_g5_i1:72-1796(+)
MRAALKACTAASGRRAVPRSVRWCAAPAGGGKPPQPPTAEAAAAVPPGDAGQQPAPKAEEEVKFAPPVDQSGVEKGLQAKQNTPQSRERSFENALRIPDEKPPLARPSKQELWDNFGVLSEMDSRHDHLTTQEFVQLWWKLQELQKTGQTTDLWDTHTTAMHKENWELNYQLFVTRLPPSIQKLYEDTFNEKYLTFRPPKVRILGMLPPQDYLEVWQAEQPTFYLRESWASPRSYVYRAWFWGRLRMLGLPVSMPKGGFAKLQVSHPAIHALDTTQGHEQLRKDKLIPGQLVKLRPESGPLPPPPRKRRRFALRKSEVGTTPNLLALPWAEIVALRGEVKGEEDTREAQVKVFNGNSRVRDEHQYNFKPNEDYELEWVALRRIDVGTDRLDYIPLGENLSDCESRDMLRFIWPAPLVKNEPVKFLYSQDGMEYPWDTHVEPTSANDFTVDALFLPYEFISMREPDLPNTLGKIAIVVDSREYPIMVDFWDALKRFDQAFYNPLMKAAQWFAGFAVLFGIFWSVTQILKFAVISKMIKPYNYLELQNHPRYKRIYGQQGMKNEDGRGPWAYDRDR